MDVLFRIDSLVITKTENTPVDVWLKSVKDVLAASTYIIQFGDELCPLSDKQKGNIVAYWGKEGAITKLLFRKNDEIVVIDKKHHQTVVNDTPAVVKEKLMDVLLPTYKGKEVFVVF